MRFWMLLGCCFCCLGDIFGFRNKIGLMCLDTRRRPRSANLCKSTRDAKKGANSEQHWERERERSRGVFRKGAPDVPDHVDKMSKPRCTDWPSRGQDTTGLAGASISKFSSTPPFKLSPVPAPVSVFLFLKLRTSFTSNYCVINFVIKF